jgi:aspartate/methionine/tyrosine aminotransferase
MRPLAERLDQIIPSASMAMAQKALGKDNLGRRVIDLTWGQPDFDTPEHIKEAAWEAVRSGKNGYTSSAGIPELRTAIADFHRSCYGVSYNPGTEILVTPGAKQGLMYLMQALVNPGDEVILFEPCWLSYRDMILLNGGIPRFIPAGKGLSPDLSMLEKTVNKRTKAVLLNNPVNPTGYVFKRSELELIADVAGRYDLYVISDEIYDRIVFSAFISLSELKRIRGRLIIANGFSKTYAMTGWRIGYLLGPESVISRVSLIHQHTATCAAAPSQYAALAALRGNQDSVNNMVRTYKKRRDFMIEELKSTSFHIIPPDGTFYAMLDVSVLGVSPGENAEVLFKKCGIAVVDGISYGESASSYVRLSLTKDKAELSEAVERLKKFRK